MHEIGPCPHYQLHGVLTLVFCIILEPHCAVLLRPEPPGRVLHRQHLRVWLPLQTSLLTWGKTYSSVPRKEWLKSIGLYCWPVFCFRARQG